MQEYVFNQKEYDKKTNKHSPQFFTIAILLCVFFVGIIVYLEQNKTQKLSYYFVQIDCFGEYSNALDLATQIQNEQGAGYIFYDGNYHVLASFYPDYDTANSVANNIHTQYVNSSVFEVNYLKQSFNADLIEQLYNLSISFDKGEIGENLFYSNLTKLYDDFVANTQIDDNDFLATEKFKNTQNALKKCCNKATNIKYCIIEIVLSTKS